MFKKIRNHEKRFYELIGIRTFRKMAFGLVKLFSLPILLCLPKDKRKEYLSAPNNYNMKKGHGIQDLKDFKKMLLFNSSIHIWGLYKCMPGLKLALMGFATAGDCFLVTIAALINLYCIMLQRYNLIRIHEAEEKYEKYQELKEKRLKRMIEKMEKDENELVLERINELISLFDKEETPNDRGVKVVETRPYYKEENVDPLDPDYWISNNQVGVKVLARTVR